MPRRKKINKRILVTGSSRSGTLSTSRMLMQLGLDVPHERMGADGCVSCYMFESNGGKPYPIKCWHQHTSEEDLDIYNFDLIVHLYRDPLRCLPSNVKIMNKHHQQWLYEKGILEMDSKPKLLRMMQMWYNINIATERLDNVSKYIRYNIRDARKMIGQIASILELDIPRGFQIKHMHKGTGYLRSDKTTYSNLNTLDPVLATKIRTLYRRYEGKL